MKKENKSSEDNRKLSQAEERRKKEYETVKEKMLKQGYKQKDLTIGVVYANVMAFVMALPFIILFTLIFYLKRYSFKFQLGVGGDLIIAVLFIVSIVIHELIHGISWAIFVKDHFKSIEFGFMKEYLTPYCTCKSPLKKYQYIFGAIMPTVILGIIPCIVSLFNGQSILLFFGFIMIISGGGDMTIILQIFLNKSDKKEVLYLDHPYKCGTMIFEK